MARAPEIVARARMSWKDRRAKSLAKEASGPALTDAPVHLQFVVSADGSEPWGIGFANGIVNNKTKAAVAKLRSAADGWTWILQWYSDLKIWASLQIPGDRGFCHLEEFLQRQRTCCSSVEQFQSGRLMDFRQGQG